MAEADRALTAMRHRKVTSARPSRHRSDRARLHPAATSCSGCARTIRDRLIITTGTTHEITERLENH